MTNIVNSSSTPYLYATLATPVANVTGDGTSYTAVWDTSTIISGIQYNTSTGTITCSIAGEYLIIANIYVSGLTTLHTAGTATMTATLGTFQAADFRPSSGKTNTNVMTFTPCVFPLKMAAGDTATISFNVSNGTKVVTFDTLSTLTVARI